MALSEPRTFELGATEGGTVAAQGHGVLAACIPAAPGELPVIVFAADPRNEPKVSIDELAGPIVLWLQAELGADCAGALWVRIDNFGRFHRVIRQDGPPPTLAFEKFPDGLSVDAFLKTAGATGEAAIEVLSAMIEVHCPTDDLPDEAEFLGVIEAHSSLPAPGIIFNKVESAAREGDAKQIAAAVQPDPVISATLINAANAARFAASGKTGSVPQSVVRLGTAFVRRIVFVADMMSRYRKGACPTFDYHGFWMNAIANGAAMRALIADYDIRPAYADEAFMTGLVSGIGWLAMAETFPDMMQRYLERSKGHDPLTKTRAYRATFPCDVNRVSARYLERFDFPEQMREAVSGHADKYRSWLECLSRAVRIGNAMSPFDCNMLPTTIPVPAECAEEFARWRDMLG